MTVSSNYLEKVSSLSGEEPVYLLEITHPQLAVPIRVVNDTVALVSNGNTFLPYAFDFKPLDDQAKQLAQGTLTIDNVRRDLAATMEATGGGKGAQVRVMQVMRDAPDLIEDEATCDWLFAKMNLLQIAATIGFEDTLNAAGLIATYRPDNTSGIF